MEGRGGRSADLDQDRSKRLSALEEKERLAREADDKAREKAGMTKEFYENLRGEMEWDPAPSAQKRGADAGQVQGEASAAAVQVGYD